MSLLSGLIDLFRNICCAKRVEQPCLFPARHFYSVIPDLDEIRSKEDKIWGVEKELPAIDWNEHGQLSLLRKVFPIYVPEIRFPIQRPANESVYYYQNDQFPVLDAEVLFCMLRHFRPSRMIEIGSGFSSLVTAEVNREHLGDQLHFTCVEPYPRQFLIDGVNGVTDLMIEKVQDVSLEYFCTLKDGDVLFIDSSHVSKIGSDVNHLIFNVIPSLSKGVLIHIHDIFLPDEYPKKWVLGEGRHWNEQYLVRAFLEFNSAFEIVWAANFMAKHHGSEVSNVFPRFPRLGGGGSLWIRRKA